MSFKIQNYFVLQILRIGVMNNFFCNKMFKTSGQDQSGQGGQGGQGCQGGQGVHVVHVVWVPQSAFNILSVFYYNFFLYLQ